MPLNRLEVARELGETSLCFLVHPTIDLNQINFCAKVIKKIFLEATEI